MAPPGQGWHLTHTYSSLPDGLWRRVMPTPVRFPRLLLLNHRLADGLGLDLSDEGGVAALLAGNTALPGADPIAQAYAGHQFGHFTMLGDGRAILLGEQRTPDGRLLDIQLKGAGRTPFSRGGDGRATVSAMLREYMVSEAMHGLGIPTTRSLSVVATGEDVYREEVYPGAVLCRVAASHLRVGTFEYARQFQPIEAQRALLRYAISRHYPELEDSGQPALALLGAVMQRQVALVAEWMRVGFIHGVMNTDNMSIAGETIDYGPCAFMNAYHPQTVFSSIDRQGRYAFGQQPAIARWNLSCLAGALLPLVADQEAEAIERVRGVLDGFDAAFSARWLGMMRAKLGLTHAEEGDQALAESLLGWMQSHRADYTNTFLAIPSGNAPVGQQDAQEGFAQWHSAWRERAQRGSGGMGAALGLMRSSNPVIIPRNHRVEEALAAWADAGESSLFLRMLEALGKPYEYHPGNEGLALPPDGGDAGYKTYCGT